MLSLLLVMPNTSLKAMNDFGLEGMSMAIRYDGSTDSNRDPNNNEMVLYFGEFVFGKPLSELAW